MSSSGSPFVTAVDVILCCLAAVMIIVLSHDWATGTQCERNRYTRRGVASVVGVVVYTLVRSSWADWEVHYIFDLLFGLACGFFVSHYLGLCDVADMNSHV